ncbi:precorrin-8X methylmutase, partial [Enterocloster hominis]
MLNIQLEQVLPSEIERRSFELIDQELQSMGIRLEPEQEPVIKRAI